MLYCTKQDLIDRFSERELIHLTDRDNVLDAINDVVLNQAISDASAIIDGYLGGKYPLPLTSVPQAIKPLACNITHYYLYNEQATEQVETRYKAAIAFFKDVAKGVVTLGVATDGTKAESQDLAEFIPSDSVFSRDKSKDFI